MGDYVLSSEGWFLSSDQAPCAVSRGLFLSIDIPLLRLVDLLLRGSCA